MKVSIPVLPDLRKVLFSELISFRFPIHHTIEAYGRRWLFVIGFIGRDILRRTFIGLVRVIVLLVRVNNVI